MVKRIYIGLALAIASCIAQSQTLLLRPARQVKNDPEKRSSCDFSSYRPLVLSHSLVNAAVKSIEPEYPELAKRAKAQGRVEVRILVKRNGEVVDACVVEGHPLLAPAAKSAALQWQFKKNFGLTHNQKLRYMEAPLFFTFRL